MSDEQTEAPRLTHIPQGVADHCWQEAEERRGLETDLLDLFRRWGYGDVIPPTFEFADVLGARANAQLRQEMYRFLDRDGSMLALRPDMTIAVARLVGTRLHDWPMPQRFCYAGSVFRYTEPQAARQREFRQAGIELIGAGAPAADAEALALTAQALRTAGLTEFRLVLGQMGYFHGLLDDLALEPAERRHLLAAVDRNSEADLAGFLDGATLRAPQRRTVQGLLSLHGADAAAIIDRADDFCLNRTMRDALENLRAICDALAAHGAAGHLFIDLTEIYNLGYYTGITFEALTPRLGFPLASGGRYDNLVGSFGPSQPAVGAALEVDRILLARRAGRRAEDLHRPAAPHALVNPSGDPACYAIIDTWRARGLRIVTEVAGRNGTDLAQAAHALGARLALTWSGAGFERHGAGEASSLTISAADAEMLMQRTATDLASSPLKAKGTAA